MTESRRHYEIGIGLAGSLSPKDYGQLAARAEEAGFDAVTVFGDLMCQPPGMVLASMAADTSVVRLGVAAYTPWTQHPVEIAGQIAMLDALSGGRAFYGLVRGAWMDRLNIDQKHALAAIEDTVAIVKAVLRGEGEGHTGRVYSLAPGTRPFYDVVRSEVPLLIGSWSPRLAAVAGRIADELQAGGSANPHMIPRLRELADQKPGTTPIRLSLNAITVVDDDRDAARSAARTAAAPYFDVIAAHDPTVELDPALLDRVRTACRRGEHESAGRLIPDDVLDKFAFSGTPDDVAEHAASIIRAGAYRVEFDTPFGLNTTDGLRVLCDRVLPKVHARLAES